MTDNEIIKVLECCNQNDCDNCSYSKVKPHNQNCNKFICENALDLISRQKAEIEELKLENRVLSQNRIAMPERLEIVNNARDKAIREFAERLKDVFVTIDGTFECFEVEEHIDELVKETTEDEK